MVEFCCKDMENNTYCIDQSLSLDNSKVIYYSSKFNEYGIPICDGKNGIATSYILISNCPWCGKRLPESKRDEWFESLEKIGYDSPLDQNIPLEFKTSEWWDQSEDGSMIDG